MILNIAAIAGATPHFFVEVAALLVAGAAIAFIGNRLGLVPIVGFLLAGVAIGPNALGLVRDRALVDAAAEVGVILLLFTIGIEFSLAKLARIRRLILLGGGLQVALATLATLGIVVLLGQNWRVGLFTGYLVALSSTAIVLKLIADQGETTSDRGQVSLALLIFQDLAIIAMVLTVPMLGGAGGSGLDIAWALVKAVLLIIAVLVIARRVMPRVLEAVARTCSPELFLLTVIAICFGTAYLTGLAGVSLSLGAFLAGLVVSESSFSEHALGEILPLQILFSATFFVSVGMLLDPAFVIGNLPLVLAALAAVVLIKVATTGLSVLALGYRLPLAASSALLLAQVGEFSFVLERAGRDVGLYPGGLQEGGSQTFIAATVLLMVLTPVLSRLGTRLGERSARAHDAPDDAATQDDAALGHAFEHFRDHVIIAGYGGSARRLTALLTETPVPFVVVTLSPEGALEAEAAGYPVLRGDYGRQRTLQLVGAGFARTVVVADDDPAMARRIVAVCRTLNPAIRVVVRTRFSAEVAPLTLAGVDVVVSDEIEGAVHLLEETLSGYPVDTVRVRDLERNLRLRGSSPARSGEQAALQPPQESETMTAVLDPNSRGRGSIDIERVYQLAPTHDTPCTHLAQTTAVTPSARGCEDCLAIGDVWVHLRMCMTCGHVGCCDSSRNKHATAHFRATSHPIVRSMEPGEDWAWCYEDQTVI